MAKRTDRLSKLIDPLYFNWIREAVIKHGRVNIQALSEKFKILPGNTYFRNFIKDKKQDYIGISGLSSILEECGYTLKLVPVKKTDVQTLIDIENITKNSFDDVRNTVSDYAESVKRAPKVKKKKGPKIIKNANLINDSIMGNVDTSNKVLGVDDIFDDEDDELVIGTPEMLEEMPDISFNNSKITKINK